MRSGDHKQECGLRLRQAIDGVGLRQVEAARIMRVSPSKLGNWLRGSNYPDPFALALFCDATGVTTDWVFRGRLPGWASPVGAPPASASAASSAASRAAERPALGDASQLSPSALRLSHRGPRRKLIP